MNKQKFNFETIKAFSPCLVVIDEELHKGGEFVPDENVINLSNDLSHIQKVFLLIHEVKHAKDFDRNVFNIKNIFVKRNINIDERVKIEYRAYLLAIRFILRYYGKRERRALIRWINDCSISYETLDKIKQTKAYKRLIGD